MKLPLQYCAWTLTLTLSAFSTFASEKLQNVTHSSTSFLSPLSSAKDIALEERVAEAIQADIDYFKQETGHDLSSEELDLIRIKGAAFHIERLTKGIVQQKLPGRDTPKKGENYDGNFLSFTAQVTSEIQSGKKLENILNELTEAVERGKQTLQEMHYVPGILAGGSASRFANSITIAATKLFPGKDINKIYFKEDGRKIDLNNPEEIGAQFRLLLLEMRRMASVQGEDNDYKDLRTFLELIDRLPEETQAQKIHKLSVQSYIFGKDVPKGIMPYIVVDGVAHTYLQDWVDENRKALGSDIPFVLMDSPATKESLRQYMEDVLQIPSNKLLIFTQGVSVARWPTRELTISYLKEIDQGLTEDTKKAPEKRMAPSKRTSLETEKALLEKYLETQVDKLEGKPVINKDKQLVTYVASHFDFLLDIIRSGLIFDMLAQNIEVTTVRNVDVVSTTANHVALAVGLLGKEKTQQSTIIGMVTSSPSTHVGGIALVNETTGGVEVVEQYFLPGNLTRTEDRVTTSNTNTFPLILRNVLKDGFAMTDSQIKKAIELRRSGDVSGFQQLVFPLVNQTLARTPSALSFKPAKANEGVSGFLLKPERPIDVATSLPGVKTVVVHGESMAISAEDWTQQVIQESKLSDTNETRAKLIQIYRLISFFADAKAITNVRDSLNYNARIVYDFSPEQMPDLLAADPVSHLEQVATLSDAVLVYDKITEARRNAKLPMEILPILHRAIDPTMEQILMPDGKPVAQVVLELTQREQWQTLGSLFNKPMDSTGLSTGKNTRVVQATGISS